MGAAASPLFCRFKSAISPFIPAESCDTQDFSLAWTSFPLRPEMTFVRLAKGAFYGLI
jgi:hypothetical protein